MEEKQLLVRAKQGDSDAFGALVQLYEKRIYAVALRSAGVPDDALDITQETFLRAWKSIETYRGDSGFSTWLFRIAMNLCVDFARRKQTRPQTISLTDETNTDKELADAALTPEEHLENNELGQMLSRALSSISEEHRKIVLLRDVSGMSYSEIAEILDISEGTVKSRLSRARVALREILCGDGNDLRLASSNQVKGGEHK